MKKFRFLIFLSVLLCTLFIFNINYNVTARDNYVKINFDDVSTQWKNTGSTTNLYEVIVNFTSIYELRNNVKMYFNHNVHNNLRTPLNRGYNSYNIISLNKVGTNKWTLKYEIALTHSMLNTYDYDVSYIASCLIDIYIDAVPSLGEPVFTGEQPLTIKGVHGTFNYTRLVILDLREFELVFNFPETLINQGVSIESIKIQNITTGINYNNLVPVYDYYPNPTFTWQLESDFFAEGKNSVWLYGINIKVGGVNETIDMTTQLYITAIHKQLYSDIYHEAKSHSFTDGYNSGYDDGLRDGFEDGQDLRREEFQKLLQEEYQKGYNAGVNDNLNVFSYLEALFGDQGLGRLLAIEPLPGVTIGAVIMIPIMFFLVGFIWRWFS